MITNLSRRSFIQQFGYVCVGAGLFLKVSPSDAIWPWVARFLLGLGGRSTARSAVSAIGRSGVGRSVVGKTASKSGYKSVVNMSLAGSILSVSPSLHASLVKYDAEAIWINSYVENKFTLVLENSSNENKQAQLAYQLLDVDTGEVELEKSCGLLVAGARDKFSFSFSISDLPYLGVKQLHALSDSKDLRTVPSGNIIVANEEDVIFDSEK